MAASSRYDVSSGSPDGPAYLNGQRGPYAGASGEKTAGSFRDGSSLSSLSRPGFSLPQGEVSSQFQHLLTDLRVVVGEPKVPRSGEMKRSMNNVFGVSLEDSVPATSSMRPLSMPAFDEIRRMKSSLNEGTTKARDRAKAFGEALSKIDKYSNGSSRKRSRTDISLGERPNVMLPGGNISRTGPQSHLTACGIESGAQKLEERAKSSIPNRRVRTSRAVDGRMDARTVGIGRPSGPVDRDKDAFKLVNGGIAPLEEKGGALPSGVDGWEKSKMKKKRSIIKSDASAAAVLGRSLDNDREPKRQQKLISDGRPSPRLTHGFRSGPVAAAIEAGKPDSTSQQNGHGTRPFPRSDQEDGSLPFDRRDRLLVSDKDGASVRAVNKSNGREDNRAPSPTAIPQVNAFARGPRSNSGSLSKASPTAHRALGNSDDWDAPQSVNKLNASIGSNNRKRSTPNSSPSPPVAQWGGQRPQKITRVARRSNLTPVISGHDEVSASRLKGEHASSSGLSESEEPGAGEIKSKDKNKKCGGVERAGPSLQKVGTLLPPPRKNKAGVDEDLGDVSRRQGRVGRGFAPATSRMPTATDNPDSAQWRSARIGSEKIESKPGRPPTKKWNERKGSTRQRHPVNTPINEYAGESDDDHEELLAAANAALNTINACKSEFWKQIEPIFGFISEGHVAFLKQQADLGDVSLQSTPTLANRDDSCALSIGVSLSECDKDIGHDEPFLEGLLRENGAPNRVSICQALLSAIIEEEEIVNSNYSNSIGGHSYDGAYGICFELDEELISKGSKMNSLGTFHAPEKVSSNGYRTSVGGRYHAELAYEKLGSNGVSLGQNVEVNALDELFPNQAMTCISMVSEVQYSQMSLNDRILLELSEIGIYPESVPDLAPSEEEEIGKGTRMLEERLHELVTKKREMLSKLEKTVMEAREQQQRELERIALDKLVGIAYEKYSVCTGHSASGSKNVTKATKHAALASLKRALVRCQKFEETGISCFNEPPFRDLFLSVSSRNGSINSAADGEVANHPALVSGIRFASTDHAASLASQPMQRVDVLDSFQSGRDDLWSNKVKKRELSLDDVAGGSAGSPLRASSGLGSSLVSGAKGKRSERDGKGQNRDSASRNSTAKIGRPALPNAKGERKNKTKPKQKTAQLSAQLSTPPPKSGSAKKDELGLFPSNDAEAIELGNLQLPELDGDFEGQGQDIGSWLNIDDDGLQDLDFMKGLDIPMDDLSEVNMML